MHSNTEKIAEWVGRCILPWESHVRAWLRRASVQPQDADDIVQEAYSVLIGLNDVSHIVNPKAYFLEISKNILRQKIRRARIVQIDTVTEIESLNIPDDGPDQEAATITKQDLLHLKQLIDGLPTRCRRIFVLRKINGVSQKEIARKLRITENTVETQVGRGLRMIMQAWASGTLDHTEQRNVGKRQRDSRKSN